uniref:Uncharacterized protein n=1 Tax=Elaeophora elaphi TaxID=1147741 RepID=A0A0R3RKP1_9BILA
MTNLITVEGFIIDQQKQQSEKQVSITPKAAHPRCIVPAASSLQTISARSISEAIKAEKGRKKNQEKAIIFLFPASISNIDFLKTSPKG